MLIVVVDNDIEDLKRLSELLKEKYIDSNVLTFIDPLMAVKYTALHQDVEQLYTDVYMKRLNGIDLINIVRRYCPYVKVYIVSIKDECEIGIIDGTDINYIKKPVDNLN